MPALRPNAVSGIGAGGNPAPVPILRRAPKGFPCRRARGHWGRVSTGCGLDRHASMVLSQAAGLSLVDLTDKSPDREDANGADPRGGKAHGLGWGETQALERRGFPTIFRARLSAVLAVAR